ncbi:MAG: HEAT repeat domain-containing protein [Gemmatimonadaceae bacterium]
MRTDFLRLTTIASIASAACLVAPVTAQTPSRPRAPVAPVAPVAPTPPRPGHVPSRSVAPKAPAPSAGWGGSDWAVFDDARDDAMIASLDAANSLNDMHLDFDALAPLASLNLDLAPMIASAGSWTNFNLDRSRGISFSLPESPRAPWASADPADSLYRLARQSLNAGDYRKAAQLFAQITRQYPTSQYKSDAIYWRAFALYRIGDTADLHEALTALDSAQPSGRSVNRTSTATSSVTSTATSAEVERAATNLASARGAQAEAEALATAARMQRNFMGGVRDNESAVLAMRIRSALAARGDAAAAAQIASAAGSGAPSCDEEDAELRVEALNALIQMDPKNAQPAITKVLARRDSCSVPLRRGAISLATRSTDPGTTALLVSTARSDPSLEVQAEAVRGLSRSSDASATAALSEIATSSKNPALQRIAVRSLAAQDSPAARQAIKNLMGRADLPSDVRITALHYAGKSDLTVANLSSLYDAASDRSTRQEIVSLLQERPESEASDKLVSIARTSTDPSLRRRAIDALATRKDPRAKQLLMDILNK